MNNDLEKLRKLTETLTSNGYLTDQAASWEYAFDSVKLFVCITNTSFKLKYVNKPLRDKLNIKPSEFINKDLCKIIVDENTRRMLESTKELSNKVIEYPELFIKAFNGWYEPQRHNITTNTDKLIGYIYTFLDVTQKRLATEALKKSEEKYRFLFESMVDGFALHKMLFNKKGKPYDYEFINVNPAFEKITGLTAKQLVGNTALNILPKLEQCWFDVYINVVQTGESHSFNDYSNELGRHYDVITFRPMPGHFACIIADITEEMSIKEELQNTNMLLNGILDAIPDAIVVQDADHNIIECNKAGEDFFNVTSKQVVGSKCFNLLGEDDICDECQTKIAKDTKKPAKLERFIDKQDKWFDCRSYPILDKEGNVTKIIEHLRDITEYKLPKQEF